MQGARQGVGRRGAAMTRLASDELKAARALIEDPARWVRRAQAVDADGERVKAGDPRACRWCAEGALSRVDTTGMPWSSKAHGFLCAASVDGSPWQTNDDRGHSA